ncbi:MAG: hypothetical protein FWE38_04170 [Firmicutes bacterium]|nr:hypothetical protein [Bacillota bacterium]
MEEDTDERFKPQPPRARGFKGFLDTFLSRNKTVLSAMYLLAMVVSGTLLVLLNNPGIMASGGPTDPVDPPSTINAVLWSFIVVGTFLFVMGGLYMFARRRNRTQI